jgi:hypothetical protein
MKSNWQERHLFLNGLDVPLANLLLLVSPLERVTRTESGRVRHLVVTKSPNFEYFASISGAKNVFFVWSPKIFLSQKLAKISVLYPRYCTLGTVKQCTIEM